MYFHSKSGLGTDHSSGERTAILRAWGSLPIAVTEVVSRGLVNGAIFAQRIPCPRIQSWLQEVLSLISFLPLWCLVYFSGNIVVGVVLSGCREVAQDKSCLGKAIACNCPD